ncbi:aquaporin-like protein [Aspergillus pseudodeflectus]|uniref:Aquaporin-like protein n=1 Tax=Aspergillus pseudodeflectus TaxID=176178 RepID=A0ABR4L6D0_9EURO
MARTHSATSSNHNQRPSPQPTTSASPSQTRSPNSFSDATIHETPSHPSQAPFISLAGAPSTQQQNPNSPAGVVYLHPDYLRYNPQYGQKHQNGPVWSLANPLPHVVRNGMRGNQSQQDSSHETQRGEKNPSQAIQQDQDHPNINTSRDAAADEPPTFNPQDRGETSEKHQAQESTPDNRSHFNAWAEWRHYIRQELAEWLGVTVAMTLGLCAGLSTFTSQNQAGTFPSLAAAWGFAFMIAIYVAGGVSGGHLNPAITISMAVWRGFPTRRCFTYILAQVLGAITASGIAYAIYHDSIVNSASIDAVPQAQSATKQAMVTVPKEFVHPAAAFFTEFIGTAILLGVIMALGDDTNAPPGAGMQAFIIGLLITVLVLAMGYTTGGCFNPARDFGGRLVTVMAGWGGDMFTEYHAWWVWGPWVADIAGGLFGGFVYDLVIFTGGESPINYPARRRKRALLLKERNLRKKAHLGRSKVPDLERAADEFA